jgi:hypothetical protein
MIVRHVKCREGETSLGGDDTRSGSTRPMHEWLRVSGAMKQMGVLRLRRDGPHQSEKRVSQMCQGSRPDIRCDRRH